MCLAGAAIILLWNIYQLYISSTSDSLLPLYIQVSVGCSSCRYCDLSFLFTISSDPASLPNQRTILLLLPLLWWFWPYEPILMAYWRRVGRDGLCIAGDESKSVAMFQGLARLSRQDRVRRSVCGLREISLVPSPTLW